MSRLALDYGIYGTAKEVEIARLAATLHTAMNGKPAAICVMALVDVVAHAMIEQTTDTTEGFAIFMSIVAREMQARKKAKGSSP